MWFLDKIVEYLYDAYETVYDAMWVVHGWVWPFWHLQDPLYLLALAFWYLSEYFGKFNNWLTWAADRIDEIVTWATLKNLILGWLPDLPNVIDWFLARVDWFTTQVTNWWEATWGNILGWLQDWHSWLTERIDWLRDMVDVIKAELTSRLNTLSTQWDYFWTVLYPQSVSFSALATWWNSQLTELQGLISSQLQSYEPFWAGWQELKSQVVEFFTDPEEWVYKRLDSFFERFW